MAMNLARTGTAGVVGVASGILAPPTVAPLVIGGTTIQYATIAEGAALLVGAGLQLLAPFTMPSVADGLVDGGIALLARRGTQFAVGQMQASPFAQRALGSPYAMPNMAAAQRASAMARGAIGGVSSDGRKVTAT